jgi:hypothetical protein
MPPHLVLEFLGLPQLSLGDKTIATDHRQAIVLLPYLVMNDVPTKNIPARCLVVAQLRAGKSLAMAKLGSQRPIMMAKKCRWRKPLSLSWRIQSIKCKQDRERIPVMFVYFPAYFPYQGVVAAELSKIAGSIRRTTF